MPFNSHFVKAVFMSAMMAATLPSTAASYQVTTITDALEQPWSVAELPGNGGYLGTEKAGHMADKQQNRQASQELTLLNPPTSSLTGKKTNRLHIY